MVILSGPGAGVSAVVSAMARTHRAQPFGDGSGDPRLDTIREIVRLLNRLMLILEGMQPHMEPDADDFMRGWGEPGGDIES